MPNRSHGKRAWLISWEDGGEYARPSTRVVAVLDIRKSPEQVKQLMQLLHDMEVLYPSEFLYYMHRPKDRPYSVEDGSFDGVPVLEKFTCGHN